MPLETTEIPNLDIEQGPEVHTENTSGDEKMHDFKKFYVLIAISSICFSLFISALVVYFTNKKYSHDIQSLKNENSALSQQIDSIDTVKSEKK